MDETQIQQFVKTLVKLTFVLTLLFVVSSCVQLRYTDYGKPFDFLKSKNQHFNKSESLSDTAVYFQQKELIKSNIATNTIPLISDSLLTDKTQPGITLSSSPQSSTYSKEVENKHKPIVSKLIQVNKLNATFQQKNIFETNYSQTRGPGWWENFWKGFWNFVLKWLLIFLCFFIVLALVIWGIYLLITVLIGPMAAAIFLVVVLSLLYILLEFG